MRESYTFKLPQSQSIYGSRTTNFYEDWRLEQKELLATRSSHDRPPLQQVVRKAEKAGRPSCRPRQNIDKKLLSFNNEPVTYAKKSL